ncbi:MAG: Holliday junction branch migration protein RuvA [Bacteroidetes bacterium]|nr:Holliday junction branch migration protein RuvA [Bacteroidota bacterium]
MFDFIEGNIQKISPTHVVIENAGMGYLLSISIYTYEKIKSQKLARVFVEQTFKVENQNPVGIVLFGFSEPEERAMFRLLTSVSGVGNSTGILMLSSLDSESLSVAILNDNVELLKSIKGIGEKTAQRIVLELRDKLGGKKIKGMATMVSPGLSDAINEALSALLSLGYNKGAAEKALMKVSDNGKTTLTVEEFIRNSLKIL